MDKSPQMADERDVIVIGGAVSGAAAAFLLKRRDPSLRVLVVEKTRHSNGASARRPPR
jgi:glycine/D-amino acid oxidase-like deaminating enzyme